MYVLLILKKNFKLKTALSILYWYLTILCILFLVSIYYTAWHLFFIYLISVQTTYLRAGIVLSHDKITSAQQNFCHAITLKMLIEQFLTAPPPAAPYSDEDNLTLKKHKVSLYVLTVTSIWVGRYVPTTFWYYLNCGLKEQSFIV